ncbi:MAG: chromosome partitioning protein [Candidatus Fischerbacteria bacterium RBG_13_37_8]|uniref:Chromosome partitioning protein n=1 Tax=Candidatus Fischerbacteria bacterium RBG_13_37_8 TaxID=1817863 RepID=A0A1F5VRI4_9BACT|nr:MAG: chromosome partitioning protein [Candidatus Fischerbacteria bacterium RBG_13_37_8]
MEQRKTRIISITNQKGGVGKTTTAINLAYGLALLNITTLLIDLDPQANASLTFLDIHREVCNIYDVLLDSKIQMKDVIHSTASDTLFLIPSRISLAKLESKLIGEIDAYYRLKEKIKEIKDGYDYIIIDTPPALGLLTVNALVASDYILIPVQASYFALEGTDDLLETIEKVKALANPSLNIIGILITLFDKRTTLSKDIYKQLKNVFGSLVFQSKISKSIRLEESPAYKESIFTFAPKSSGAEEYMQLAKEVLKRV